MGIENHILKVSFCGAFQKAVKPQSHNTTRESMHAFTIK